MELYPSLFFTGVRAISKKDCLIELTLQFPLMYVSHYHKHRGVEKWKKGVKENKTKIYRGGRTLYCSKGNIDSGAQH